MNKVCVVLQGPHYPTVIHHYRDVSIIVSTWPDEVKKIEPDAWNYIETLVVPDPPKCAGFGNLNYQTVSTTAGLKEAKTQGFTHAFKIRSDIYFSDISKLIKLIDYDKLNFLCYHNYNGGYYVDYICFGPIDKMLQYWDLYSVDFTKFAEKQLSERWTEPVAYILPILVQENLDAIWTKPNLNLKDYAKDSLFTLQQP